MAKLINQLLNIDQQEHSKFWQHILWFLGYLEQKAKQLKLNTQCNSDIEVESKTKCTLTTTIITTVYITTSSHSNFPTTE
jgi:hypothetical protein